jgi:uncharacterized damage-inducible protein DinB
MNLSEMFARELEHESASTRKMLERLPDDQFDYKPHPKSMALGPLATHIAQMVEWTLAVVQQPEYDIPADYKPWQPTSRAEILAKHDEWLPQAVAAIRATPETAWADAWALKMAGNPIFTLPRMVTLRTMILNHIVHHRAQLGVYLRLLEIPLPAIYGPSADESGS